ncbi:transposase [Streptomyces sp. NBC_01471]
MRADGFDVHDEDVARLSPFVRRHINMHGRYSFQLPDLLGGMRPLRDSTPPTTSEYRQFSVASNAAMNAATRALMSGVERRAAARDRARKRAASACWPAKARTIRWAPG